MDNKPLTAEQKANIIVNSIIDDIQGRKGIGDEFENIRGDILHEMLEKWTNIALEVIKEQNT